MRFGVVASGVGFAEGPVALAGGGLAVVSIDRGAIHRIDDTGAVRVLAVTGGGPNGLAEGHGGTLFAAQNGGWLHGRRATPEVPGGVQAIGPDGAVSWVSRALVAPNDLCFGRDGLLYVTDPSRDAGMRDGRLWRVDPASGEAELLAELDWYPNGIGFPAGDDALYVARTGERRIVRFALDGGGLGRPEDVAALPEGLPDGFAWDADGHLVAAVVGVEEPGFLAVLDGDGRLLDRVRPGSARLYTNVAIALDGTLYVTDADEGRVLGTRWPSAGLALHPLRSAEHGGGQPAP